MVVAIRRLVTVTRVGNAVGEGVLVDYSTVGQTYTDIYSTNVYGTNIYFETFTNNADVATNNAFFTTMVRG